MRPIIGVPLRYQHLSDNRCITYMAESVRRILQKAGGNVFPIPPVQDTNYIDTKTSEFKELTLEEKQIINDNLDRCDGLFLPGGMKFTPYDRYVLEVAIEKKIPTLAVCLSMQMMSCYQEDVELGTNETGINHDQENYDVLTHKVYINEDSKLFEIIGEREIMVNSFHKYHALENHIYKTVAISEDGLIEGIEYPANFFNMGIQWHPEVSYDFDENSRKIINYFINEAKKFSYSKNNIREIESKRLVK